ncbi:AAA family ATPase [Rhizobium leguminosarum]|uniref:AAA family ATPase n=1 Tax=Rhizobium leguminosarum TaxID=384 RepID=UPI001C957C5E|nr:AAA family ATPase [Rhizobium leguminosarum]MBY5516168.1 AAA family ATPase [Rhizobium leguminosarum]
MDKALVDSLDKFIFKLQGVSEQLKSVRTGEFRRSKRNNAAIAKKSATNYLSYCSLVRLFRKNIGRLSEPFCVAIFTVPHQWQLGDVHEAAKFILKGEKGVKICVHPTSKHRRGWEIDAAELLESGEKLIIFAQDGLPIHEDFELAATVVDQLKLCDIEHLRALSHLRGCGTLSEQEAAVIAEQRSERMEAIFRPKRSAAGAAAKLDAAKRQDGSGQARHLDVQRGFGEASIWAETLKRDLDEWRQGSLPWSEIDKGCLFFGPTGTGKTRFAAALAADCDMHLEAASVAQWQSFKDGDLGDLLKAMYKAFDAAKENAPSLLFIDEIDAIGDRAKFPARHETYSTTVVNALLECLDGTVDREGVIVIGACNFPERIDPALLRSGRLEKHIHFPMPDAASRAEILAFHLPTLAADASLKEIGTRLPGKSGADLERLGREARRRARREKRDVTILDLKAVIRPTPPLDAKTLYRVAVHEAGHAVIARALLLGKVEHVEIYDNVESFATLVDSHGTTLTKFHPSEFVTRWDTMKMITYNLAGAAAEDLVFGHRANWSSGTKESDLAVATQLAVQMVAEHAFGDSLFFLPGSIDRSNAAKLWEDLPLKEEVGEILREQHQRAKEILDGLKPILLKIADALVEHKRLDARQLDAYWPRGTKTTAAANH